MTIFMVCFPASAFQIGPDDIFILFLIPGSTFPTSSIWSNFPSTKYAVVIILANEFVLIIPALYTSPVIVTGSPIFG